MADTRFPNASNRPPLPRWLLPAGLALIVAIAIVTPWARLTGTIHRLKGDALADGPQWVQNRKLAFDSYRAAAEHGDAEAQVRLGEILLDGEWAEDGIPQDDAAAMHWFQMAADQDDPAGQAWIGWMHDEGRATREDDALAFKWYTKSAEQEYLWAQTQLGWMYEAGLGTDKDVAAAMRWYRRAAEAGDVDAQVVLGKIFVTAEPKLEGVTKDDLTALSWFRRAAEQGDADGQHWMGYMYSRGLGVHIDDATAARWFTRAAEQGLRRSQNEVAWMYHRGLGVPANDAAAVDWYRRASQQDSAWAQYRLGWFHALGHGVSKDEDEALRLFRVAAEAGLADAQVALGDVYRHGRLGVGVDLTQAVDWYQRAAKQNDDDGSGALAEMHLDGHGLQLDYAMAQQLADGPARRANVRAQYVLGRINAEGLLGYVDIQSAYVWYSLASAFGHANAMEELRRLRLGMTPEAISASEAMIRQRAREYALTDWTRARFEEYQSTSPIGAFAVGLAGNMGWTEGYATGSEASANALALCEAYRYEDAPPCRLFAVGRRIVFGLPQAEIDRVIQTFVQAERQ